MKKENVDKDKKIFESMKGLNPKSPLELLSLNVNDLKQKASSQRKMSQSFLILVKNIDYKIEALVEELEERKCIVKAKYEARVDKKRGVRLKDKDERIEKTDIVWVSYKAVADKGKKIVEEKKFPIRMGTGKIAFENVLFDKQPHSNVVHTITFPQNAGHEFRGQTVQFDIKIHDVKAQEKQWNQLN